MNENKSDGPVYHASILERVLFKIAKKWIAGNCIDNVIEAAITTNNNLGAMAIINYLGEHNTDLKEIDSVRSQYLSLIDAINYHKIDGCLSIKPTQIGLSIDSRTCYKNISQLVEKSSSGGIFVWIDMESYEFVEKTISIYLDLINSFGNIGIAIQAYLKRSASDLLHLIENNATVRIVKGAYKEPEEKAFQSEEEIRTNFLKLMQMLFHTDNLNFAVATHDKSLINHALSMSREISNSSFEFQFLKGIRDDLKKELVRDGYKVGEYIPYGTNWLPYSVRRITERKRNLLLLVRSLV